MNNLYKFYAYFGRMGSLFGLFVATKEEVNKLAGKNIYFGEVLGKHSDVSIEDFDMQFITCLSEDQEKIQWLVDIVGDTTIIGKNPLNYLNEEEDE